MKNSGGFEQN